MISTRSGGEARQGDSSHSMHGYAEERKPALRKISRCLFPETSRDSLSYHEVLPEWTEEEYIPIQRPQDLYNSHTAYEQTRILRRPPSLDESVPTYSSISTRFDADFPRPTDNRLSYKHSYRNSTCTQSSVSTVFTEAREDQYEDGDYDTSFTTSVPGAFPYTPTSAYSQPTQDNSDTTILYPTVYTPKLLPKSRNVSAAPSPKSPGQAASKSMTTLVGPQTVVKPRARPSLPSLPAYREQTSRPETPLSSFSRQRDGSGASSSRYRDKSETPSCRRPETPLSMSSVNLSFVPSSGSMVPSSAADSTSRDRYTDDDEPSEYEIFLAQTRTMQNNRQLRTQNLPSLQVHIPNYPTTPSDTPQTTRALDELSPPKLNHARSGSISTANSSPPRHRLAHPKLPSTQSHMFSQNKFPLTMKEQIQSTMEPRVYQPARPRTLARAHSDTNASITSAKQSRFSIETCGTPTHSGSPMGSQVAEPRLSLSDRMRALLQFSRSISPAQHLRNDMSHDVSVRGRNITPVSAEEPPRMWNTETNTSSIRPSVKGTHPALREQRSQAPSMIESFESEQERGRGRTRESEQPQPDGTPWRWSNIGKAVKRSLSLDRHGKKNVLQKSNRDSLSSKADQDGSARRNGSFGERGAAARRYGSMSSPSDAGDELRRRHSRVMPTSKALDRYNMNFDRQF